MKGNLTLHLRDSSEDENRHILKLIPYEHSSQGPVIIALHMFFCSPQSICNIFLFNGFL